MNFTNSVILNLLIVVLLGLVIIFGFNIAHIYYLKKLNVNKWILLAVALVLFAGAFVLAGFYPTAFWHLIPLVLSIFFFLWFIEARRKDARKPKEKKVVMKAKAKPSRAKKNEDKK